MIDPLSVFMMLIVSGIGALIVAYSIGYMDGDNEERRYFAYMALFVFSMLLLVQGGNLLIRLCQPGGMWPSYHATTAWYESPLSMPHPIPLSAGISGRVAKLLTTLVALG